MFIVVCALKGTKIAEVVRNLMSAFAKDSYPKPKFGPLIATFVVNETGYMSHVKSMTVEYLTSKKPDMVVFYNPLGEVLLKQLFVACSRSSLSETVVGLYLGPKDRTTKEMSNYLNGGFRIETGEISQVQWNTYSHKEYGLRSYVPSQADGSYSGSASV